MLHFFTALLDGISSIPLELMLAKRSLQGEERVWKKVRVTLLITRLIGECIAMPINLGKAVYGYADLIGTVLTAVLVVVQILILLYQYCQCRVRGIVRLGRNLLWNEVGVWLEFVVYKALKNLFGVGILADAYGLEALKTIFIILVSAAITYTGVLFLDQRISHKLSDKVCKAVVVVECIVISCTFLIVSVIFVLWQKGSTYGSTAVQNTFYGFVIIFFVGAGIAFVWILLTLQKRSLQKEVYYLRQQETLLKNYYLTLEQKNELVR